MKLFTSALSGAQKWFVFGEAAAHLKYLQEEGRVMRDTDRQEPVFFIGEGHR